MTAGKPDRRRNGAAPSASAALARAAQTTILWLLEVMASHPRIARLAAAPVRTQRH